MYASHVFGTAIAVTMIVGTITTHALAQEMIESFYITGGPAPNSCIIVDYKPTPDGVFALSYDTRALAEAALAEAARSGIVPNCGINELYG